MPPILITTLRWIARIAGLIVLLMVLAIAIGEGFPNPLTLKFGEQAMMLVMLVMLAGIVLSWKWVGLGGAMLLMGYTTFLINESMHRHHLALFSFVDLFFLLGLIDLVVWWSAKHSRQYLTSR